MATNQLEPMLWLSGARGRFIPRDFANSFANWANVLNVSDEDKAILQAGPEHDDYWEAWSAVLDNAVVRDDAGNRFTVYQDGDCWLIPIGMNWDEESAWFQWETETV